MIRKYWRIFWGLFRLFREKAWNNKRLKLNGIMYYFGKNSRINTSGIGVCNLGRKTWVDDNCYFSASDASIEIGFNNYFSNNCRVVAMAGISIGDNNLLGPNVVIVDHNHRFSDKKQLICKQGYTKSPITIGSDVWLGANVIVSEGVSICDHVVVGANAVITKSITESGVYGGIPAKLIRRL
ncbi:MAG: acyltransferase [Aeriscardovia sp.]|nr:acyltransferase [Aeriscardovia sp.]